MCSLSAEWVQNLIITVKGRRDVYVREPFKGIVGRGAPLTMRECVVRGMKSIRLHDRRRVQWQTKILTQLLLKDCSDVFVNTCSQGRIFQRAN
ncbi:hypothetical protein CEXT_60101 [Caerostris extrusa]|uniref:Uncharacterized protein n=1 Tax=Caerostris extrusa TaxID=172846 RepID=A0AAV4WXQ2_CAEEX|nr:hypothetical protein CEXT_60101 [Caerostris extrusa]